MRFRDATLTVALWLGLAFLAASWVFPRLHLRPGLPRSLEIPRFESPGRDAFFSFSVGEELSQSVLYHDLGSSIDHARQADILFFGNSRMPLGLREEAIVPAAEESGLRVFSLACGHSEKTRFALELIRRHDLRPAVVVASGGPHLFTEGISEVAERAMGMKRWEAWKEQLEIRGKWALQSRIHTRLPKLDLLGDPLVSRWIIYRSSRTGWWRPVTEPDVGEPVTVIDDFASYDFLLPLASELQQELRARGAQLVLTMVPYRDSRIGHLPFLAKALGVPYVLPPFDGLRLADGSHLDRDSGRRYGEAFWERFVRLPEIRKRLHGG